jgi:hypothetical protein
MPENNVRVHIEYTVGFIGTNTAQSHSEEPISVTMTPCICIDGVEHTAH